MLACQVSRYVDVRLKSSVLEGTHSDFVSVSSVRTMSIDSVVLPAQKNCLTQLCPTPTPRTFGNDLMRSKSCSLVDGLPTWTALSHA